MLTALGDRVAPVTMARERTLPVADDVAGLFADGGLVRGRVLSSTGSAATSTALRAVAPAVQAGSWVAVVDVATFGLDAASEMGIPLERVVAITTDAEHAAGEHGETGETTKTGEIAETGETVGQRWADVVAAAADGFDVVITRVPAGVRAGIVGKVAMRVQQRGVVMVVLGDPGALVCDGVLHSGTQTWSGLGRGWGHLRQRSVEVVASGRRLPGQRRHTVTLPPLPAPSTAVQPATGPAPSPPAVDPVVARPELSNAS